MEFRSFPWEIKSPMGFKIFDRELLHSHVIRNSRGKTNYLIWDFFSWKFTPWFLIVSPARFLLC